jgi:hypothetical protein
MGVFDRYKKNQRKKADKRRVDEKVWAKSEDNKIYLEKDLNDELLKSFFSSGNKTAGSYSQISEQKEYDENYEGEKRAAMFEASPATIQDIYDDLELDELFPRHYSEDKNHYFNIEYDKNGNISRGISIKRVYKNNDIKIKIWIAVDGKEEMADFENADPEDIKDWIESTIEELQTGELI